MVAAFRWSATPDARQIGRRLMLERANRDARRLPTKPWQGTLAHLGRLIREYSEAKAYYADNPPHEWINRRGMADLERIERQGFLIGMRQEIMTEIRRHKLFRDGYPPAYSIGTRVWFPSALGYSVVVFGEFRDGEWSYVYSHPFEGGKAGAFGQAPVEAD